MIKNNKNNYQNNNYGRMPLRHNQRPSSAGGKNKIYMEIIIIIILIIESGLD